jgi:hypothetical protein
MWILLTTSKPASQPMQQNQNHEEIFKIPENHQAPSHPGTQVAVLVCNKTGAVQNCAASHSCVTAIFDDKLPIHNNELES